MIENENIIGHFTDFTDKFKPVKEFTFHEDSGLYYMALIENKTKVLITDYIRNLIHLIDFDGKLFRSFNPNNTLKIPVGICVLRDSNDEEIYIGDSKQHKIFVFNSNFELKFQFGDNNLKYPGYLRIDDEFDKSRLYVSDCKNNEITIWNTKDGKFIHKIDIETPRQINFTCNSLYASSPVFEHQMKNNQVTKINQGGNCIFEIDKESFEIKRRIVGNWYSPNLLKIETNGYFHIAARIFDDNVSLSEMRFFITVDQNGKIMKKVELFGIQPISDVILVKNKIIVSTANKLKLFEFE
jgi:DNA-binding beta-propeller fold protein YncE